MTRSEQINELMTAMAKAQAVMTGAKKDADNPFFKSHYADLASVRDACMPALNANGLSVIQFPRLVSSDGAGMVVEVETILAHSSGQFIADTLSVPVTKADAQGVGSAITYARRYALGAVAGVAAEDDDGESAVGRAAKSHQSTQTLKPVQPPPSQGYRDVEPTPLDHAQRVVTTTAVKSGGPTITEPQQKRLYAIIKSSRRDLEVVKAWLFATYGVQHSKDITKADYQAITAAVEAAGALPGFRDTGEDDDYDDRVMEGADGD